jgi:hypothetical protein
LPSLAKFSGFLNSVSTFFAVCDFVSVDFTVPPGANFAAINPPFFKIRS